MATHPRLSEEKTVAAPEWLPDGWRAPEGPHLDLDAELAGGGTPPLAHADGSFALIIARDALPGGGADWAEWTAELRRLLVPDGVVLAGLAAPAEFERLTGERWDEDTIGISVLPGPVAPRAFHSGWWLRAHLGRAFELSGPHGDGEERHVALRARGEAPSTAELEAPEPGEPRELVSAQAEIRRLVAQAERVEARHRLEVDGLQEELDRELMRKAFEATASGTAGWENDSGAALVASRYEATTSWKVTRPMRAAGRLARRLLGRFR